MQPVNTWILPFLTTRWILKDDTFIKVQVEKKEKEEEAKNQTSN